MYKDYLESLLVHIEILQVLKNTLQLSPLIRYVKDAKAANTIPPSYRINLVNDTFFDIYYLPNL